MTLGEPRTARDEFTVITLCGSMRFREEFERLDAELTLAGHVVLTPTALAPSTVGKGGCSLSYPAVAVRGVERVGHRVRGSDEEQT